MPIASKIPFIPKWGKVHLQCKELTNCNLQLVGLLLAFRWLMGENGFYIFLIVDKINRKILFWPVKST